MKTENETESVDSLELAKDAINYPLGRIRADENIRYHMGACTECFERLKRAHSALTGISEEAIEAAVLDRQCSREPHAVLVERIKEVVDADMTPERVLLGIRAILGR